MRIVDVVLGAAVAFVGILPYIVKVEGLGKVLGFLGNPGSTIYQAILIALGAVLIIYGSRREYLPIRR